MCPRALTERKKYVQSAPVRPPSFRAPSDGRGDVRLRRPLQPQGATALVPYSTEDRAARISRSSECRSMAMWRRMTRAIASGL